MHENHAENHAVTGRENHAPNTLKGIFGLHDFLSRVRTRAPKGWIWGRRMIFLPACSGAKVWITICGVQSPGILQHPRPGPDQRAICTGWNFGGGLEWSGL